MYESVKKSGSPLLATVGRTPLRTTRRINRLKVRSQTYLSLRYSDPRLFDAPKGESIKKEPSPEILQLCSHPVAATRPQDLSSRSTFPTPSALWTNPGRCCQKLCIGDRRILVGTAGKELDNQRAEIGSFIIPAKPGRSLSFFPAAHHTSTASEFSLVLSTRSDSFKLRL